MKNSFTSKFTALTALIAALATAAILATSCAPPKRPGRSGGKPFPEVVLKYNTSESHKAIAEAIQQMWNATLGVNVQIRNEEWKVYLKDLKDLNYSIARAGWNADYSDPNTFMDMWLTGGGNNQTGWSSKWYDERIAAAQKEFDPMKRMAIFKDAEDFLVNKELPILPIYFYVNTNVVKTYVKGMTYNVRDIHLLKSVYIEKNGRPAPPAQQVFTFNNGSEPETLDPHKMTGSVEFNIVQQLFEGLVVNDPETLVPMPGIAEKWEISPDGLTYTFHLRKNAKWSNGDPITAKDFLYSWKRALDPATASDYAYQLYYIKNGKPFNEGKLKDFSKVGVKVIDDYTIQTVLETPTAFWLDLIAFPTLLPVNEKCVAIYRDKWTRPENIVTSGAFNLSKWEYKDKIEMVRNPNYWDSAKVKLQKIVANATDNNESGMRMFKAGETDWVRTVPVPMVSQWNSKPETHHSPLLSTYYYRFNVTKPPFNDPKVRMAFNLAVDKDAICKKILKAGQLPATTFVPPGMPGYTPPKGQPYNPEKAKQLLKEAGY